MIGFFYAIALIGAGASTFFSNLEPLIVAGTSFLLLGQALLPLQFVGVLVVVSALIFYARADTATPVNLVINVRYIVKNRAKNPKNL